ncbi:hypothetical protein F4808DRAFT_466095 [Astrocystis sublimbata]|nr:hypothetical protein F4808DRAFT_466095 [Astrocystis sublimbata]
MATWNDKPSTRGLVARLRMVPYRERHLVLSSEVENSKDPGTWERNPHRCQSLLCNARWSTAMLQYLRVQELLRQDRVPAADYAPRNTSKFKMRQVPIHDMLERGQKNWLHLVAAHLLGIWAFLPKF